MKENYSWSDMANFMTDCGIPHSVVAKLADPIISIIVYERLVFNLLTFDDYLHERYGDYKSEGKSQEDIFKELFGDKIEQAKYYFGITNEFSKSF
jgi:hypothetical protein